MSSVVFENLNTHLRPANRMDLQIFKFQWKTKPNLIGLFQTKGSCFHLFVQLSFKFCFISNPKVHDDESMMAHGRTYFKFYATTNGSYLIEYFGFKWSLFKNEKWD